MRKRLVTPALSILITSLIILGCGSPEGPSIADKILSATKISNGVSDDDMKKFISFAKYNDLTESELKNCLILMKKAGVNTDYVVEQTDSSILMKLGPDDYINPTTLAIWKMAYKNVGLQYPGHVFKLSAKVDKDKSGNKVLSQLYLVKGGFESSSKGAEVPIYWGNEVKTHLSKFILTKDKYNKLEKNAIKTATDELKEYEKDISNIKVRYSEAIPYISFNLFSKDDFYYKALVEFEYEKKAFAGNRKKIAYADDFLFDENLKYVGRINKEKKFIASSALAQIKLVKHAFGFYDDANQTKPNGNQNNKSSIDVSKTSKPNVQKDFNKSVGIITSNEVAIRKGPSTKYESKGYFIKGDKVSLLGKETDGTHTWYKVEYNNPQYGLITGYVRADFIKAN